MKKILLLCFCSIISSLVLSQQHELQFNFFNIHSLSPGSGSIAYKYNLKKHSFYAGMKYHYNPQPKNKLTAHVFFQNFRADNFGERLGVLGGYEYHVPFKKNNRSYFFTFFEMQFARMGTRSYSFSPYDPNNEDVVIKKYELTENFNIWNWAIGIGLSANIASNFNLNVKIGPGFNHYRDMPTKPSGKADHIIFTTSKSTELSYIGSIGVSYLFVK